jgi:hypothetical protein
MRTKLICLLLCTITFKSLKADDAPLAFIPGGNVKPITNTDVQLESETIDIYLLPDKYSVEVNYYFKNTGKARKLMMGFPSNKETKVLDYKVFENNVPLPTVTRPGNWEFNLKGVHAQFMENPINSFECFEVVFKEGETKQIKDVFNQLYTGDYDGEASSFFYILKTGSLWKDKINSVKIRVHTEKAPKGLDLRSGELNGVKISLLNYSTEYTDLEPTEDLIFIVRNYDDFHVSEASSELLPKDVYVARNIQDIDPTTAWVEGVKGDGIGETISFYTNKGHNQGEAFLIDSIGIINGYAKSPATFKNNGRVKKLFIRFDVDNDYEPEYNKPLVKPVMLSDSPDMQIIRFKTPIKATDIEFKIAEVYKGEKFDDTAISEVKFYISSNK